MQFWYNWIAWGANKAMPHLSVMVQPIRERCYTAPNIGWGNSYLSWDEDYRMRIPPHDGEVVGLLMVRAGLEWLEHLKGKGKL